MAIFGRLRCHFCGARSAHSRGCTEFQCQSCEARNFFDKTGNVVDAPISEVAWPSTDARLRQRFTSPPRDDFKPPKPQAFCDKCVKNQQIFLESISNYLPDEEDPRYPEYEARLPVYKKELESRYPQICVNCAPNAQTRIHDADLQSQRQMLAASMKNTRSRNKQGRIVRGMRDTPVKKMIRTGLSCIEAAKIMSLTAQVVWHLYAVLTLLLDHPRVPMQLYEDDTSRSVLTLTTCARLPFTQTKRNICLSSLATYLDTALTLAFALSWHNPALRYYWHDTYAVQSTTGKVQYYQVQLIMLLIRQVALSFLSDIAVIDELSTQRSTAINVTLILFLICSEILSRQKIGFQRRTVNSKIMPLPEEQNILGAFAGPAATEITPQASSLNPFRLFQRDDVSFKINNLAPKASRTHFGHPSPPHSQPVPPDEDAMDIDWEQPTVQRSFRPSKSQQQQNTPATRSLYNHSNTQPLGWSGMRSETFRIEDDIRSKAEQEQQEAEERRRNQLHYNPPVNTNPFRGKLPPAPMSMERRLRNPPQTRFEFGRADTPAQANFMNQMREGIEEARTFRWQHPKEQPGHSDKLRNGAYHDPDLDGSQYDPDELADHDRQGVRSQQRRVDDNGIRPGQWTWKGDLDRQTTGLEDLFGGDSFRIGADGANSTEINARAPSSTQSRVGRISVSLVVGAFLVILIAMAGMWFPVRRAAALWMVGKMEEWGY